MIHQYTKCFIKYMKFITEYIKQPLTFLIKIAYTSLTSASFPQTKSISMYT